MNTNDNNSVQTQDAFGDDLNHVDCLNDLVIDLSKRSTKKSAQAVESYCEKHDLDPSGYDLQWIDADGDLDGFWSVEIAETQNEDNA